jgi:hypothetical protein
MAVKIRLRYGLLVCGMLLLATVPAYAEPVVLAQSTGQSRAAKDPRRTRCLCLHAR